MDTMENGLPNDPLMLLSVVNTKLRDYYASLELLCEDMHLSQEWLCEKLRAIDYEYDAAQNRFL